MKILDNLKSTYPWTIKHMGGIFQVQLNTVKDLEALATLDPKLWVALSCPVNDLEIDPRTLSLIDYDADGRVRIEEMRNAVAWTLKRLAKPDSLFSGGDLPLDAINTSDPEGEKLLASAKQILANMGASDATSISVEQAANTSKIYGQSRLNGDGVIAKDATDVPELQQLIAEIMDCLGANTDRSGEPGITQKKLDAFLAELKAYEVWWAQGELDSAKGEVIFPLGDDTPTAFTHLLAVEKKIDDFFARCQLAAFDARAEAPLNHDISLYKAIAEEDFSSSRKDIERLPLAKVSGTSTVPLFEGINPEWKQRMQTLCEQVVRPLNIGTGDSLEIEEWQQIKSHFKAYRKWRQSKPETQTEKLPITRVREILDSDLGAQLAALLAEDHALAPLMKSVDAVEKLARFHRDLICVLNNFVNFNDFYDESQPAIFQAGVLYLDGRECRLCLRVANPAKHAVLATLSRAFVAYCECRRKDSKDKFYIAAVFSAGDSANLIVGRNGIFQDRQGRLWDTTIVRLIENPISIREAFLMPYARVGRFIGDKLEKWAVTRDKAMQKQMETGVETVGNGNTSGKTSKDSNIGGVAGMLAAGGIALGAVGAGLASLFETFNALNWWEIPLVIGGLVLMISLPSMLIAWLKIRKRTLAPLLDASGWAVNGRTLISPKLGRSLTSSATLPIASCCQFDERNHARKWLWIALGIAIFATVAGWTCVFL
ncbi:MULTISPECIES: hypothetical protein [unclassified Lentimonas]|uniref:hypothetical protein n=1 Tax=unclassified Lentimonas TaxID=2630993 RepID=UPI00132AF607|nr:MULTISPECIES: hypothetical protein [unclassified Lentimonas]CAA6678509.1 Unannotated [Lentimonas sp. CC4]CAA6685741.1 Unannotated [Lentimonas sp. CC6]CAA7076215.1 Unannotated [Lentimonas sp. CC4]CAA7168733.1 Unannotated [Lentimonas sp. CC21]CAA7183471.1 Unannotated [Lentimonas sp. CC8]